MSVRPFSRARQRLLFTLLCEIRKETFPTVSSICANLNSFARSLYLALFTGKTTLVDKLLKAADENAAETDRLMDSGDLEKERGITITSKVTRIAFDDDVTINCAGTYYVFSQQYG